MIGQSYLQHYCRKHVWNLNTHHAVCNAGGKSADVLTCIWNLSQKGLIFDPNVSDHLL